MSTSNNGDSLNKKNICIPVDIEIRDGDGCSAYALSLQMIFKHVAEFHMTVVDIISEKYNIPVDEIMNAVTSDSRYKNMMVDKIKKKINEEPNKAVVGKLRALSVAPVINITSAKTEIFSDSRLFIINSHSRLGTGSLPCRKIIIPLSIR